MKMQVKIFNFILPFQIGYIIQNQQVIKIKSLIFGLFHDGLRDPYGEKLQRA